MWLNDARAEALRISGFINSSVTQTLSSLRSYSALFYGSSNVSAQEFSTAAKFVQSWDAEIPIDSLAYAQRVTRRERAMFEAQLGMPLRVFGSERAAPKRYESFGVVFLGLEEEHFRRGDDLMTVPEMRSVVATAYRAPDNVILGPMFRIHDGHLHALAGYSVANGSRDGVVVALLNFGALLEPLVTRQTASGLSLRLIERDNEGRAYSVLNPVIGGLEPAAETVATFPVRMSFGQARWELDWDVMPWYKGGPQHQGALGVEWGGGIASLVIGLALFLLADQHTRVRRLVEKKTAELHNRQQDLVSAKEQAEIANRAKTQFLASMSHELRTPLNAIIGFSEIIKDEAFGPVGNQRYLEFVEDIHGSGQHLLSLINDLLDLSKIESGKDQVHEEVVVVDLVIHSAMKLVRHRANEGGVDLQADVEADLPELYADQRKLTQILVNLLSNAIKFTDTGGRVNLKAWFREDQGFVCQITDTGIGIEPDDIPRALSHFTQLDGDLERRFEGTGLGLPLAKSLTELHGGSLDMESQPGVGTIVTVCLPASRRVEMPPHAAMAGTEARLAV